MKAYTTLWFGLALACFASVGYAQEVSHSDVFFAYGESQIQIEPQAGRLAFPQIMPNSGFFTQANANPGFASERDIGGGTGPTDIVGYNVLDDLIFWSDGEFSAPKPDTEIRIINNPGSVDDTIVGTGTGEQRASFDPRSNSIGQSSSAGDFHSHVDFRLEPVSNDPEEIPLPGAYGLKLSLSSDNDAVEESDPFFVVFRFGIEEEQFTEALDDFDSLLMDSAGLLGDFDSDGLLSAADIDLLSVEANAGTNTGSFDITGDQVVDALDRTHWVEELFGTFFGDADLDGRVQFSDFLTLSSRFGAAGGWSDGDFDGNGEVEFADFLSLADNFGNGEVNAASVPEPFGGASMTPLALLVGLRRSRHSRDRCKA